MCLTKADLADSFPSNLIRNILTTGNETKLPPSHPFVETGTQATLAVAIMKGAHIVRVHNVANTCATARLADALKQATNDNEKT